ncbi:MAG TPA: DUF4383 domain-containing protein [Ktedonobacteraceae bacterium]
MIQETKKGWTPNRTLALVLGIVFLILGLVGFITPTENSTGVRAILGIFDSDTFQNVFLLITGLLGLVAAFTGWSVLFNRVFGVVYTLVGLLGLIPALYFPVYGNDNGRFLGLTHLSVADHILDIVLGLLALALGFYLIQRSNSRRKAAAI